MRHQRRINRLSRTSTHRSAMFSNMATSLIIHKRIFTTLAKAKALRTFVEPLITKSKDDSTHSRRMVFSFLQSKEAVTELFRDISVKVGARPGGYTRIIKTGKRAGDNSEMAMIELVDYNPNLLGTGAADSGKGQKKVRRGAGKKKVEGETLASVAAPKAKKVAKEVEPEAKETATKPENKQVQEIEEQAPEATETTITTPEDKLGQEIEELAPEAPETITTPEDKLDQETDEQAPEPTKE